jgi:outer membrane protein insertion porin family
MRIPFQLLLLFLLAFPSAWAQLLPRPLQGKKVLTEVRVAGMKTLSEEEALNLVGARLEHVRSQPPSASRADDAAFMVQRLFRTYGFSQCQVTWKFFGRNSVQLIVTEGPRELLGEVRVEGMDKKSAQLLSKLYEVPAQKRSNGIQGRPPFIQDDVAAGIDLVVAELHSRGFWTATATLKSQSINPANGNTDLVFSTNPGPLHLISEPTVVGITRRSDALSGDARRFIGQPANTASINGMRSAVETFYRQRGFTEAKILMTSRIEGGRFVPGFTIEEGKSFQLGTFTFEGLGKTRQNRIRRRFADLEHKTLDNTVVDKRLREMMATGAFESVRMETKERDGNVLDATLHFVEADARGYTVSAGFGSYEGPILGVSYYDRNYRGMMMNLSSGFEITGRTLLGEVGLTNPWLFGKDVKGNVRLFMLSGLNEGYTTWRAGGEAGASWQASEHYALDLRAGWAFVNTNDDGIPSNLLGGTVYANPFIRFNQRLDYRDSKVLPTKGWNAEFPIEIGAVTGEVSTTYVKSELGGAWRRPVGEDAQIALGARAGFLMAGGNTNDFPIDLRFFLGGPRSVRSYAEREMGPRSLTGYPIGGEAYWVANAEYIHSIAGPMKLVGFVDAGSLSRKFDGLGSATPDVAAGLGVRFDLPVGPVRLEYGHNLTRDGGEPSGAFHFAIGVAF